jgi:GTPase SAR1 family protein
MSLYYRSANVALLCLTKETVEWASDWVSAVRSSEPACSIVVIFTKSDLLSEDEINALFTDGEQLCRTIQAADFVVTSAKTGQGVQDAFTAAARVVRTLGISEGQRSAIVQKKSDGGCCG